jgi:diguanylate cyclase (GGDEF)-like protein/PAS domain S-box-containing protein
MFSPSLSRDPATMRNVEYEVDLESLLDSIQEFIVAKDGNGRWLFTNRIVLEAYDLVDFDYQGITDAELMAHRPQFKDAFSYNVQTDELAWSNRKATLIEKSFMGLDGRVNTWEVVKTPYFTDSGERHRLIIVSRNVTERKIAERALQESEQRFKSLAYLDALTGLANRRSILDQISDYLSTKDSSEQCALFYLDLDRFKSINDEHGHALGDRLLMAFADRVNGELRRSDLFGRIGGDEFIIFLRGTTPQTACAIAHRLCDVLQRPWCLGTVELRTSSSIGITYCSDEQTNVHELLRHADEALYQAKRAGRSQVMVYQPVAL